jgi:hypothetical protein
MKYQVNLPTRQKCQAIGAGIMSVLGNWSENFERAEAL